MQRWPEKLTLEGRAKAKEVARFIFKGAKSKTFSGWLVNNEDSNDFQTFRQQLMLS